MPNNDELKKVLDYALHGVPEIKIEEKRLWLGEFRERVVMGITFEQALEKEALKYVENALKDPMGENLIVNGRIPMEIMGKYMQLAKKMNREYKTMASNNPNAMGVVVASKSAINRDEVVPEIKMLPDKFKYLNHNSLCPQHYQEIKEVFPEYIDGFQKIGFGDKMMGIKCGACNRTRDSGPLI